MQTPQTYIFFGRSGSGKGTQAELLKEYLERRGGKVVYIETGQEFRKFAEEDNYVAKKVKETMLAGGLLPAWLPVYMWGRRLVEDYDGTQHLILDGLSRKPKEAPVLDSALKFFGHNNFKVLNIEVSREEAEKRLLSRGRSDDVDREKIKTRLDWYDRDVLDVLDYFDEMKGYQMITINGEQGVEEVFAEIIQKLRAAGDTCIC